MYISPINKDLFSMAWRTLPLKRPPFFLSRIVLTALTCGSVYVGLAQIQGPQIPQFPTPGGTAPANQNQNNPNQGLQQYQQDMMHQADRKKQLDEMYREIRGTDAKAIKYQFPSLSAKSGTTFYKQALDSILLMLRGVRPLDLGRAVFFTENAYYDNHVKYTDFDRAIKTIAAACRQQPKEKKHSEQEDNTTKILALYHFFSDTTYFNDPVSKKKIKHLPFYYDFEDYLGIKDWSKMFVTKLLAQGSGQCHSLPMLFLVCCQELGAKAYLSFSPDHCFIRFVDSRGRMRNIELTNGRFTTDAWILGSGYVKGEALKSRIYLDTLDTRKVVAQCVEDLVTGYTAKFGYDDFVLKAIDSSLYYFPNNINAVKVKADYYSLLFNYIAEQYGKPTLTRLLQDPRAKEIYAKRNEMYDWIDNSGYTDMPSDAYQNWLMSVNEMKQTQEDQKMRKELGDRVNLMKEK